MLELTDGVGGSLHLLAAQMKRELRLTLPAPCCCAGLQVCPVEAQWVQAILPRLEGIDVNRLR